MLRLILVNLNNSVNLFSFFSYTGADVLQFAFRGPLTLGLLLRKILLAPLPPFHAGAGPSSPQMKYMQKTGSLPKIANPLKKSALSRFLGFSSKQAHDGYAVAP